MVSKILSVAALAGVAMAACPLSVEIASVTDHTVHVAVKNNGKEAITVFKGDTVLSGHANKDLVVLGADDKALPFEGMLVNYKTTGMPASMFQTLQPGESVTSSVNAAKTYQLAGVASAKVAAHQLFRYVTGTTAPTALKDMETCETLVSNTVSITPNQSKVAADKLVAKRATSSRVNKRDITYSNCDEGQTGSLTTDVNNAISMAGAARDNAAAQADNYNTWFIDNSQVGTVQGIYSSVTNIGADPGFQMDCAYDPNGCPEGTIAYTVTPTNVIFPCPAYYENAELTDACDGYDRAGTMLHEMTHVFGTDDVIYGYDGCKTLSSSDAARNADTYRYYAQGVRLGGGCA